MRDGAQAGGAGSVMTGTDSGKPRAAHVPDLKLILILMGALLILALHKLLIVTPPSTR